MKNIKILVKGLMNQDWEEWFSGFSLAYTPAGETALSGLIRDQAELRGLVTRIADLGLELISIETNPLHNPGEEQGAGGTDPGSGNPGTTSEPPERRENKTHKEGTMKRKMYLIPVALIFVFTAIIAGVLYGRPDTKTDSLTSISSAEPKTQLTYEQTMAFYGFLPEYQEALATRQIMGLYGYWADYEEALDAWHPIAAMTVDQIQRFYGYTDEPADWTPEPMTAAEIKAIYGYTDEPQAFGQRAGADPAPMTVDQIKLFYGYVEAPGPEFWELEIVPPIYTYPWYIRP